jgi:antitoxin component YwqK of YwqJK toxin-antitoxin module
MIHQNLIKILLLTAVLWPISCQYFSATEIAETRDEQGRLERYERRKKDFAKEGLYQKFHPNGKVAIEAHYVNDTLHGMRKYFYENGNAESIENFVHGEYEGAYQHFHENGTLQLEQTYIKGALQGISKTYYENGILADQVTLVNNEEDGPFVEFYENGTKKAEGFYTPGPEGPLEQGELKEYNEAGELIRTANCKNGVCTTVWKKENL